MANTKSARKAARQIARRTVVNKSRRSRVRSAVRQADHGEFFRDDPVHFALRGAA